MAAIVNNMQQQILFTCFWNQDHNVVQVRSGTNSQFLTLIFRIFNNKFTFVFSLR